MMIGSVSCHSNCFEITQCTRTRGDSRHANNKVFMWRKASEPWTEVTSLSIPVYDELPNLIQKAAQTCSSQFRRLVRISLERAFDPFAQQWERGAPRIFPSALSKTKSGGEKITRTARSHQRALREGTIHPIKEVNSWEVTETVRPHDKLTTRLELVLKHSYFGRKATPRTKSQVKGIKHPDR